VAKIKKAFAARARSIFGKERVAMTKWEYKIINIRSENYRLDPNAATQLNQLGEEGWELVSITSVNFKTGATDNIAMVFKRPVAG
jgi:selenocysteine lyase/cysteine desulfurase